MGNATGNFTRNELMYFYKSCSADSMETLKAINECTLLASNNESDRRCVQFCDKFPQVLPWIYTSIGLLSAVCCLLVFLSYVLFPRLRHSGHSTKVFLFRTLMDFIIAVGHIVAGPSQLAEARTDAHYATCAALGCINQVAILASSLWFFVLAFDLLKAIRNPFSARPTSPVAHVLIWPLSLISGVVLALLVIPGKPGGPGPSMFFWCWVSVESTPDKTDQNLSIVGFSLASLGLYYVWLGFFWLMSMLCIVVGVFILQKRLATSSETRRLVLRQNFWYVLSLGLETITVIVLWILQLSLLRARQAELHQNEIHAQPYFFSHADFIIAVVFAVIHSLRGTVDFVAWCIALSLGREDFKDLYRRIKNRDRKESCGKSLRTPLLGTKSGDSIINRALRRNAMYCINVGILDAVQLHQQALGRIQRIGSVRDRFVAGQMLRHDEENQFHEREELYRENPDHREQSIRRLQFPATATIQSFSFIDLEPSTFSHLRTTFGTTPKKYRESFKISNAADIDKEGMLEKFTEGKSGSFFYFTRDFRYIIKTVNSGEESFLQKIAYRYYHHMHNNPNSVIARFYGMHKVRLAPEQRYITVVVMDNIFHNKDQLKMHERYDLKGSWVGRRAIKGSRERNAYKGTLKDLDLGDTKVCIGTENKELLIEQLKEDAQFLQSCDIMDYSLLLGIHYHNKPGDATLSQQSVAGNIGEDFLDVSIKPRRPRHAHSKYASSGYGTDTTEAGISPVKKAATNVVKLMETTETNLSETTQLKCIGVPWFREDFGGLRSCSPLHPRTLEDGRVPSTVVEGDAATIPIATYYFGIIDILQEYNVRKKAEHFWKTRCLRQDKHGLSAVNAKEYSMRFTDFMETIFQ